MTETVRVLPERNAWPIRFRPKRRLESVSYAFDWTHELAGDTVSTATWAAEPAGLTISGQSVSTPVASATISGGKEGQTYDVTCRIVTGASGETLEGRAFLRVDRDQCQTVGW